MKTVTEFPLPLIDLLESKRLLGQHLRDVNEITPPFDFAIVSYPPNDNPES